MRVNPPTDTLPKTLFFINKRAGEYLDHALKYVARLALSQEQWAGVGGLEGG